VVVYGARHGRKTSARGFDGYKGHVSIDPDCELVTATTVTAGNAGDAGSASDLLAGELAGGGGEAPGGGEDERLSVYGDAAYGAGELLKALEQARAEIHCTVQPPAAPAGQFTKDAFSIDLPAGTVTCPAGLAARHVCAAIRR
jgi:hypothetical protein